MKVVVLHDVISEDSRLDERDAVVQAEAVCRALTELGHEPSVAQCSLDLAGVAESLRRAGPDLVFNLVESVGSHGRLIHLAPALLDCLRIPYTGVPTEGMFITSNKLLTKQLLASNGVATPPWATVNSIGSQSSKETVGRFIVKSVWEHASVGMDDAAVIEPSDAQMLRRELAARQDRLGGQTFAERYIDGREFNISVLGGHEQPEVLPFAEIEFVGYAVGKPKIVGYAAKWEEQSYEYSHTPRRFDFAPEDRPLLAELADVAKWCWSLFGLRGYARVDFRVDPAGRPWVLEINANPCLSPDAGFFAAAQQAGLTYAQVVERILADVRPCPARA
jgi:D-alanine-D-alanine ligase